MSHGPVSGFPVPGGFTSTMQRYLMQQLNTLLEKEAMWYTFILIGCLLPHLCLQQISLMLKDILLLSTHLMGIIKLIPLY